MPTQKVRHNGSWVELPALHPTSASMQAAAELAIESSPSISRLDDYRVDPTHPRWGGIDSSGWINAINSAGGYVSALGGGSVFFPRMLEVTPTTGNAIRPYSNVTYEGNGYGTGLRVTDDAGDYSAVFRPTAEGVRVENVSFRNFRIDQNAAGQTVATVPMFTIGTMQAAIALWNAENVRVDCWFDECTGVNTVIVNGAGFSNVTDINVKNSYFVWGRLPNASNPDPSHRTFDNSAIYVVGERARVQDNTFLADPLDAGRATCEFHGPDMVYTGNIVDGYQTIINLGTMWAGVEDRANWIVANNTGHNLMHGIVVASASTNNTSLMNIHHNTMHINTPAHGLALGNGIRISGDATISGVMGDFSVDHNVIVYEPDSRTTNWDGSALGVMGNFAGIYVGAGSLDLNGGQIVANRIVNAPTHGIHLGTEGIAGAVVKDLLVESNSIRNNGYMKTWNPDVSQFNLVGDLQDIMIRNNRLMDEGGAGTEIGKHALRGISWTGLGTTARVYWQDNQHITPNGASLLETYVDFAAITKRTTTFT